MFNFRADVAYHDTHGTFPPAYHNWMRKNVRGTAEDEPESKRAAKIGRPGISGNLGKKKGMSRRATHRDMSEHEFAMVLTATNRAKDPHIA